MSVVKMQKILVASHASEAAAVLEEIQDGGLMQIYDAEKAYVSKDFPELHTKIERPKQLEDACARADAAAEFLNKFAPKPTLAQLLAPKAVISKQQYYQVLQDSKTIGILDGAAALSSQLAKLAEQEQHIAAQLELLSGWENLDADLADLDKLQRAGAILGLLPAKNIAAARQKTEELLGEIETIGSKGLMFTCVVVCLKENSSEIYKALRALEFEAVNFSGFKGQPKELIEKARQDIQKIAQQVEQCQEKAAQLGKERLDVQILADHYRNQLEKEKTLLAVPESDKAVLFEGWIKKRDLPKLGKILSQYSGTSIIPIDRSQDEEVPVHIENSRAVQPFEVITNLYGKPQYFEVDPTWFLSPFFAIFFALCLADVGAGLILMAISALLIKKLQGDKKLLYLLFVCGFLTIFTGAMTGGWFGTGLLDIANAHNISWLKNLIEKTMWFDPLSDPMKFFAVAVALGYFQIMLGLFIGFVDLLRRKEFTAAICDKLVWLLLVNSLAVFGAAKAGAVPAAVGGFAAKFAILPAAIILLFSHREGGWGGRIGMGTYQLFSTVFYLGDILSYLRLMALGISSAGVAMAINVIGKTLADVPYVGMVLAVLLLVFGHIFATASSALGAFVHTMRLQFVEYFPKFLVGGGKDFTPLSKQYKYVYVKSEKADNK